MPGFTGTPIVQGSGISCNKTRSRGNLKGMDDLDFTGWNNADWDGVFAHHHTDDVLVDWKGQPPTHGIDQHIDAMKAYVESSRRHPAPDHVTPDRVRIRRVDLCHRRVRGRGPHGDRRQVERWRHHRGVHLGLTGRRPDVQRGHLSDFDGLARPGARRTRKATGPAPRRVTRRSQREMATQRSAVDATGIGRRCRSLRSRGPSRWRRG